MPAHEDGDSSAPDATAEVLSSLLDDARGRLADLDAAISALRHERAGESADDEHDPEGTPLSGEWSRLEGLRAAAVREVAAAESARQRLAQGVYGICTVCGAAIAPARLEARPSATRCIECATRLGG